jgi:UDPglucose 6-dehydrogenase
MSLATERLISGRYLRGGMGDGGGCHPRDNIAMSWLAGELDLSYDFFDSLMKCREEQTMWLANLIKEELQGNDNLNEVIILGQAFKEETNLTVGSPATLLKNLLEESKISARMYDPHVQDLETVGKLFPTFPPAVYFVATKHDCFRAFDFPAGSVVLDPWRFMPDHDHITVIRIGQNK